MRESLTLALRPDMAVPVAYALFLALAFTSYQIDTTEVLLVSRFGGVSPLSYAVSAGAILLLTACARLGKGTRAMRKPGAILPVMFALITLVLHSNLSIDLILAVATSAVIVFLLWLVSRYSYKTRALTIGAFILAVASSLIALIPGVPLLDVLLRTEAAGSLPRLLFHVAAVFSSALLISLYDKKRAIAGIGLLFLLGIASGFKSDALAILLAPMISGILLGKLRRAEIAISALSIALSFAIMGTYIASRSYDSWVVPPIQYAFYRAGFTFSVFDRITSLSFPFGHLHGGALLGGKSEVMSTVVLGYTKPIKITSTLIGPSMLDFGVFGVALMACFVGICLGVLYGAGERPVHRCLYSTALAHALMLIESGQWLYNVVLFLSLLYLSLAHSKGGRRTEGPGSALPSGITSFNDAGNSLRNILSQRPRLCG